MKRFIATFIFIIVLSSYSFASTGERNAMNYNNAIETEISGYTHNSHGEVEAFGYNVPLQIHYNDSYKTRSGYPIVVDEFLLTDGIPTLKVTVDTRAGGDIASYKVAIRCYTSEDAYTDIENEGLGYIFSDGVYHVENEPLSGVRVEDFFKMHTVQSIEIWIDECDYT